MTGRRRFRAGAALLVALLLVASPGSVGGVDAPMDTPVAELTGAGFLDKVLCLGCGAAIVGVGGATIGGVLLAAALYPEFVLACGYQCYIAFA